MFIKQTLANEIYESVGKIKIDKAQDYIKNKKVYVKSTYYENMNNFSINAIVNDEQENYNVKISSKNGELDELHCQCPEYETNYGTCEHIVATLMEVDGNPKYSDNEENKIKVREKYTDFKDLINTFYEEEMKSLEDNEQIINHLDKQVKIVPKIIFDNYSKEMKIEFKIGTKKQLYKLRDLVEFYENMQHKTYYKYGAKLEIIHEEETFSNEDKELLNFILKHAETIKYVNNNSNTIYRYYGKVLNTESIVLSNTILDELFEILKNKEIAFEKEYKTATVELIDKEPDIKFELEKISDKEYQLICNIETYNTYEILEGKKHTYVLLDNKLYRCSKEFEQTTLKLLDVYKRNFTREIKFDKQQVSNFFSIVLPKVRKSIGLNAISDEDIEKYMPQKLIVKVFLEFNNKNYIIANVKFCYGEEEFNPLERNPNIPRSVLEEVEALNLFRKTGFMLDKKKYEFVLADEGKIYNFLLEDITEYMQKFEVLATDDFKDKQIKQPKITSIGVRVENQLLNIDLEGLNFDKKELKEILQKYKLKKKYHRLKDGTFLSLQENKDIEFLDNLISGSDIDYKQIDEQQIQVPIFRSMYLEKILSTIENINAKKDDNYKTIVNDMQEKNNLNNVMIPEELENILRAYQKTGYKWLKNLDLYKFGGILADDMGLGKTIQIISIILDYKKQKDNKPIIVICPSSLSLNWKNEIEKFAPSIKTQVIYGNAGQRRVQIDHIQDYDIVITSYDLLKRDIEIYKEKNYEFRYAIADEAQYIKNSNTQNAKAIKQIKAVTKYALTGTPIENSLSELWSIFDFLMPGYLFSYRKFKEQYELPIVRDNDEDAMRKLKMLIEPFILRRTKKEVLTELPDKTITILNNEMEKEQQDIYLSYLSQARKELKEEIEINGIQKSKIKILSLLTRLRQICCHPSLFIDNYKGESSKLNQCVEIVKDAIESGHKILLFSGYTSMFEIIEKELKKENIEYFKLTGQTKVSTRVELVDQFNKDENIKVFLISLKAGGTGLNLTGADMVIHYDPWWNLSAENQATDRAYRIGQKNNVQVYKLITKNSIEEKIYELQEKKAHLIDNVLDTKTSFISTLSKEDIIKLFN